MSRHSKAPHGLLRVARVRRGVALASLSMLAVGTTMQPVTVEVPHKPRVELAEPLPLTDEALESPASQWSPTKAWPRVRQGDGPRVVQTSLTSRIPAEALAAYQRAETVINNADRVCNLSWELIAAIGRVESDHGRHGGNVLGTDGVSRPGIYGVPLNGRHNTAVIRDTDAGQYDRDGVFDRAVGPMQFIPSTWAVLGVDADGDNRRNPQDVDDAALASAVHLCSGSDDLATNAGRRVAVDRYNHSRAYVDLVLAVMAAYLKGDSSSVLTYAAAAISIDPDVSSNAPAKQHGTRNSSAGAGSTASGVGSKQSPPASYPPPTPQSPQTGGADSGTTIRKAVQHTTETVSTTATESAEQVLPLAQAVLKCTIEGQASKLLSVDDAFSRCVDEYINSADAR